MYAKQLITIERTELELMERQIKDLEDKLSKAESATYADALTLVLWNMSDIDVSRAIYVCKDRGIEIKVAPKDMLHRAGIDDRFAGFSASVIHAERIPYGR